MYSYVSTTLSGNVRNRLSSCVYLNRPYISRQRGTYGRVSQIDRLLARETAVMRSHLNARGDSLPAASGPDHR